MNYTIDKFEPQQGLVFNDLKPGDMFSIIEDNKPELFVKLTTSVQPSTSNTFFAYNAVSLIDGDLVKVRSEASVRKMVTKLHFVNEDFTPYSI